MFAQIKQRLNIVDVEQTPTYIVVEGIGTHTLFADMYRAWGSNVISKYMFSVQRSSMLKMRHFFGLDFLYVCQTLYDTPGTRTPKRVLAKVIHELKDKTWLGEVDRDPKSITHFQRVEHGFIPFPYKPFQEEFAKLYGRMVPAYRLRGYMLDAGPGTGKAQPLSAKIKVPGGWKAMGDIQVGDRVIARDGSTTVVTGVYPQGKKDIYTVTFADGRQTKCCAEHLWEIYNGDRRDHLAKDVVNTMELIQLLEKHPKRIYIPLLESEASPEINLPIDPYLLGVLLGDGCMRNRGLHLSTPDSEIVDAVASMLPENMEIAKLPGDNVDYILRRVEGKQGRAKHDLIAALRTLSLMERLSHEKFIPTSYLHGSHSQRLAMLQGLMDTDGYVDKNSHCSFTSSSEQLAKDVQYLVRSLGGIAKISMKETSFTYKGERKQGRLAYTVLIRVKKPSDLFRLTKKKDRTNDNHQYAAGLRLRVNGVEKTGFLEAQCISVDHPEHLYVTDDFIVTHNTLTQYALAGSLGDEKVIIVTPKNALHDVWKATIDNILLQKKPYWMSDMDRAPSLDDHYYLVHYEALGNFWEWMKPHLKSFKGAYIGLDESHNFNRQAALRTQTLIDMIQATEDVKCLWASGTPLLALGSEMIPFLKCVDPLFDDESEERFRKIYGRDAKRANDILRNRIGHLKYHVPKQDVVDGKPIVETVKVKIPNGADYTLEAIGKRMADFVDQRQAWYKQHFTVFRNDYDQAIELFEKTLKSEQDKRNYKAYKEAFRIVSSGFDPRTMKAEAQLCNSYELRTIYPMLPNELKPKFKSARSVIKYLPLKVMGEALGTILGKARAQCHVDMIPHIELSKLIDDAKKKTLIFTSFVEVVDAVDDVLTEQGYTPAKVYGATNKDLPQIVSKFYKDPDLNPLTATYQSLSTAVPLTAANTLILINQPFRSGIREQTIARAHRLGQDMQVYVFDVLLDTGEAANISTRSNDIMAWSQQQVAEILGTQNVDLDSLALESKEAEMDGFDQLFDFIGEDMSMESAETVAADTPRAVVSLPGYLYHGSMYKQNELMPGFKRSHQLVRWDKTEDNTWLYTSDNREDAIMLGISSAIEKKFLLDRYRYDAKNKTMILDVTGPCRLEDIHKLEVYLYTLRADKHDGWQLNFNPENNIVGEYKTQDTIDGNILRCEKLDIRNILRDVTVKINCTEGYSTESLSDIVKGLRSFFGGGSKQQKKAHSEMIDSTGRARIQDAEKYVTDYFANPSWLKNQEFHETISAGGIAAPLSRRNQFGTPEEIERSWNEIKAWAEANDKPVFAADGIVQDIHKQYRAKILKAVDGGDSDEVDALISEANKKFDTVIPKLQTLVGHKVEIFGGKEVEVVKDTHNHCGVGVVVRKGGTALSTSIPGLDAAGVAKVAALTLKVIADIQGHRKCPLWLDFEDGDDFYDQLRDFDDSAYMAYGEKWYFQRLLDFTFSYDLVGPYKEGGLVLAALLTWMDRSIK